MDATDNVLHNQFMVNNKEGINGDVNFGYDPYDPGRYILYFLEVKVWML